MELFVGALVVLGFLAILVRFLPRDAAGNVWLPRIVDNSIGMWLLRRATGRRLWERPWDDDSGGSPDGALPGDGAAAAASAASAGQGAAGPARVSPVRHVVSGRRPADPVGPPAVAPILVPPARRRRYQAHRTGAAALMPGFAAIAGTGAAVVVGFTLLGVVLQPRGTADGEVLAATGTPGATARPTASVVSALLPSASGAVPTAGEPSATASAAQPTSPPATAVPTRRPTPTPVITPAPTPTPTATPKVTPKPSSPPAPTPTPTPTPPPAPPVASISCSNVLLVISCDGSGSARAVTYAFDFGDGTVASGSESARSHTYTDPGAYTVTLTVTDALGRTNSDATSVSVP